jgi:predicted membrane channel-forming protein YqfA (hemolysin III family)
MEAMAGQLYTVLQADTSNPMFWLAVFFVTGLAAMIIIALAVGIVVSLKFKAIRKKAEQAGVQVDLSSDSTRITAQGIEGCGYCIVCTIVLIFGALGITLPIVLTQQAEDLILAIVMAVLGALCWGATIAAIPISVRDLKKRYRALDDALAAKAGKEPEAT